MEFLSWNQSDGTRAAVPGSASRLEAVSNPPAIADRKAGLSPWSEVDPADSDVEARTAVDERWIATRGVAESRHFVRSPLLSKFLLYVVTETLEGRQESITEHQIGVQVFGRAPTYRTVEDNIVRNYARQLRKRLAEHFAETETAQIRIEIPVGGYVPLFTYLSEAPASNAGQSDPIEPTLPMPEQGPATLREPRRQLQKPALLRAAMLLGYSVVLVALTAVILLKWTQRQAEEPAHALWQALFAGAETTYVVPPDAGFNLLEDMSHRTEALADYMQSSYNAVPLPELDAHSATDLRSEQLTDFMDVQMMISISRLKEYDPARVQLRFPRDLRMDDLKNANAVLIGSVCSNPWAAVKDAKANFTIVCSDGMQGSTILNRKPKPGEATTYASHWNEPTHETYALVSFLPNLSGSGHLLFLEGLDVAGTQAASEALLESDAIKPILRQARRADGSIAPFEVLVKATSIEANATDVQVIASRVE